MKGLEGTKPTGLYLWLEGKGIGVLHIVCRVAAPQEPLGKGQVGWKAGQSFLTLPRQCRGVVCITI